MVKPHVFRVWPFHVAGPGRPNATHHVLVAIAALVVLMAGSALAQDHDHEHAEPPSSENGLNLREQLVQATVVARDGLDLSVEAVWATPAYFRFGDAMAFGTDRAAATEAWAPSTGTVFVIDETTHTDRIPEASLATDLELVVDGRVYQPERVRAGEAEEHHRSTIVRFAPSPYQDAGMTLRLANGDELTWRTAEWFGVSSDERVINVIANEDGFSPGTLRVQAGEPLVFVFQNPTDLEHHFHILDLEPEGLRWFLMPNQELSSFEPALLETAERVTGHMCTSETGICRLATNVHLHANPQAFDAVGFVAPTPGTYEIVCPLHAEMSAEIVVQ